MVRPDSNPLVPSFGTRWARLLVDEIFDRGGLISPLRLKCSTSVARNAIINLRRECGDRATIDAIELAHGGRAPNGSPTDSGPAELSVSPIGSETHIAAL